MIRRRLVQTQKAARRPAPKSGSRTPPVQNLIRGLSRLSAPLRGQKRSKSRQSFDLYGPAIGPPALKQDGVYRIFQPKGQTQIVRREDAADFRARRDVFRQRKQLAAAVGGPVRRLDDPRGLPRPDIGQGFLETGDKHAFAPGKPQLVQTASGQQAFDRVREVRGRLHRRLGGPREQVLLHRRLDRGAVRRDPQAAPRQLARQVGGHRTVRSGDEADQARFVHDLVGDEVASLSIDRRFAQTHERSGLPSRVGGLFGVLGEDLGVVFSGFCLFAFRRGGEDGFGVVFTLGQLFLVLGLGRLRQFRSVDPAGGDTRLQDQHFGLFLRQVEAFQHARDLDPFAVLHFVAATDFVGGQVGQILDGLHPAFAQGDGDGAGHARNGHDAVLDAQLDAFRVQNGGLTVQEVAGAGLQLLGRLLVKAFDVRDFVRFDEGQILDRGESFGDQQLGDDLIHVQGFLEQGGALAELALAALGVLALGDDVDLPAGQLAGEADVLAAAADGQRQLLVRHHHFNAVSLFVEDHLGDFGRREGVHDERRLVVVPLDDVDLLALQFGDDRLNPRAAHADAGADRIDGGVVRQHSHLGARAGVAGGGADLDHAVVDFRHFLGEQLGHEAGVRTRQHDLRALCLGADVIDVCADPVADVEHLARDGVVAAHDALAPAQVDDGVAGFDALDGAVDDLADAVLGLFVLVGALGLADLPGHDLTGHLGLDAAELERRQGLDIFLADEGLRIALGGVGQADHGRVVELFQLVFRLPVVRHDGDVARQGQLARLDVDLGADVVVGAVARFGALLDRLLDRLDDDLLVDVLLARDRISDLQQFESVRGNAGYSHVQSSVSVELSLRAARFSAPAFIS